MGLRRPADDGEARAPLLSAEEGAGEEEGEELAGDEPEAAPEPAPSPPQPAAPAAEAPPADAAGLDAGACPPPEAEGAAAVCVGAAAESPQRTSSQTLSAAASGPLVDALRPASAPRRLLAPLAPRGVALPGLAAPAADPASAPFEGLADDGAGAPHQGAPGALAFTAGGACSSTSRASGDAFTQQPREGAATGVLPELAGQPAPAPPALQHAPAGAAAEPEAAPAEAAPPSPLQPGRVADPEADDDAGRQVEGPGPPPASGGGPDAPSEWTGHDWPEAQLPELRSEAGQTLRVFIGTWNLHGQQAPPDLRRWVPLAGSHHLYVLGTCECETTIKQAMIWSGKARWEQQIREYLGEDYRLIGSHNMGAIHIMVLAHQYLWRYCWDSRSAQVATGFGNVVGNKGGTQVGFSLGHTSLLFINAHLPAHNGKMKERTQCFGRILEDSPIRRSSRRNLEATESSVRKVGVHQEYDRVFFMGDLNARVNATRADVDDWLSQGRFDRCLEQDELLPLLNARSDDARAATDGPVGLWPCFEEATITFPPTYKFDVHTDRYDTSKKQRVPSWTDRILWKRDAHVRPLKYTSVETLTCSDHRPIFAQFEVTVDLKGWQGPDMESPKHVASRGPVGETPRKSASERFLRKDDKSQICSLQ